MKRRTYPTDHRSSPKTLPVGFFLPACSILRAAISSRNESVTELRDFISVPRPSDTGASDDLNFTTLPLPRDE